MIFPLGFLSLFKLKPKRKPSLSPTVLFLNYCESTPWAPEARIYDV